MECLAHNARKNRSRSNISSLKDTTAKFSRDPSIFKSTTSNPLDPAATIRRTPTDGQRPRIGVVGAGMAGLRSAKRLSDKGCDVTVFEARGRIGGRVHQIEQSGHLIDMGSNWIHGSKNNPILTLAQKLNNVLFEPPEGEEAKSPVYDEAGNEIDSEIAIPHSSDAWDIVEEAMKYSQVDGGASIPPEISLMDYFREAVDARGYAETSQTMILQMAHMWSNIVGESLHQQSLRYLWLEECIEGENWFLASTYKFILETVRDECMAKAKVHLNTKVTSIESRPVNDGSHGVFLATDDGATHSFDEVVMTAPLGWLKRNPSAFTPPLPQQTRNSINHIGYGRLEKVYINFPHAFWQSEDPQEGRPFFMQFFAPDYAPEHNPKRWTIECASLASLPTDCAHATLLFYINGSCSEYVTSLVRGSKPGSLDHYLKLESFFSPYYSRLSNYEADACKPVSFCSTDWQNDEFAGNGSYTTFQTSDYEKDGLVELDKDIDILRVGCPERSLWFAGEHTAPTVALGTTTGAYWSGEAVAERIGRVYCLHDEKEANRVLAINGTTEH